MASGDSSTDGMKGDRISSALSKNSRGNVSAAKGGLVGAVEMTQWVKVVAVKSSDLSSISRIHTVEGENWLPQAVL